MRLPNRPKSARERIEAAISSPRGIRTQEAYDYAKENRMTPSNRNIKRNAGIGRNDTSAERAISAADEAADRRKDAAKAKSVSGNAARQEKLTRKNAAKRGR